MITQSCGEVKRLLNRGLVQHLPTIDPPPVEARLTVERIRSTLAELSPEQPGQRARISITGTPRGPDRAMTAKQFENSSGGLPSNFDERGWRLLLCRSGTGFRAWWWSPLINWCWPAESVMIAIGGGMAQNIFRGAGAGPGKRSPWLKILYRGQGEPSRTSANATEA